MRSIELVAYENILSRNVYTVSSCFVSCHVKCHTGVNYLYPLSYVRRAKQRMQEG